MGAGLAVTVALGLFSLWMSILATSPRFGSMGYRLLFGIGAVLAGWALLLAPLIMQRAPKVGLGMFVAGALFMTILMNWLALVLVPITILAMVYAVARWRELEKRPVVG